MISIVEELMAVFMVMTVIAASSIFAALLGTDALMLSIGLSGLYFCITFVGFLQRYNRDHYESTE